MDYRPKAFALDDLKPMERFAVGLRLGMVTFETPEMIAKRVRRDAIKQLARMRFRIPRDC